MKLLTNYKYWISNFFGWILFAFLMLTIDKISYSNNMGNSRLVYVLIEGFLCGFLGFLLSFPILFYIEKYFDINDFKKKDVFKLILVFLIVQLFYHLLLWPILDIPARHYLDRPTMTSFLMKLTNVPHFMAYFIIWLFIVFSIKIYYHIITIKLRQAQLQTNLKESQLNTLKGQINPHFMFNSLNNIRGLMLEDVAKSRDMLTRLSEAIRYSLTKNNIDSIALEDELEMVENYVEISKIQLEDRLQFETQIKKNTLSKQIPPMIIQMLVENAIKHGIANLKEGGKVLLKTQIEDDKLLIDVVNSGTIKQSKNTTQLGLENIKQRLELLYADKATFSLYEANHKVVASIKIPLD